MTTLEIIETMKQALERIVADNNAPRAVRQQAETALNKTGFKA